MPRSKLRLVTFATLAAMAAAPAAYAATKTSTLGVEVQVVTSCAITGGSLDFGTYTSGQSSDKLANTTISYTDCGPGDISIEMDGGREASIPGRKMSSGSNKLSYQLYRSSGRTDLWGIGANAQKLDLSSTRSSTVTVYGKLPKDQSVEPGSYTDTVAITITF